MAKQFEDVTLKWNGTDYTIPADRMMEAICRIEEHVTLEMLHVREGEKAHWRRGPISRAYASVLRFAGAKVTDEEIYTGMFDGAKSNVIGVAVQALLFMMIPPSLLQDAEPKKE